MRPGSVLVLTCASSNKPPQSRQDTNMPLTFFSKPTRLRHITWPRWIRSVVVVGLAFTVSACAYDSGHYRSHSGYTTYHGYYDNGHSPRGYYSHRPDHRTYDRRYQPHSPHRAETRRHHYESRNRVERQRRHEAHQPRSAGQRAHRINEHRNRAGGGRPQHERRR